MVINYKDIADRAVEIIGDIDPLLYETAYNTMVNEFEEVDKTSFLLNEVVVLRHYGFSGTTLLDNLKNALHASIYRLIENDGIDICHANSKAYIEILKTNNIINQSEYDWIISLTKENKVKWPGLKPGHVQNALEYRLQGKV